MAYTLTDFGVIRHADGACIFGPDPDNPDWLGFEAWVRAGGVPNPKVDLEQARAAWLEEVKCLVDTRLLGGFTSEALGTAHAYDSALTDQLNLNSLLSLGVGGMLNCRLLTSDTKTWVDHTPEQVRQVVVDWTSYRQTTLQAYTRLRAVAAAATTLHDLPPMVL